MLLAAMDFLTVSTLTFGVLYCFFLIAHDRRRVPKATREDCVCCSEKEKRSDSELLHSPESQSLRGVVPGKGTV